MASVRGHSPHDVANAVFIQPNAAGSLDVFVPLQLTSHSMLGRSRDGGLTWTVQALPTGDRGITSVRFSSQWSLDGTAFLSTSGKGILKTSDSGKSWTPVDTPGVNPIVIDLALAPTFPADGTILAATRNGASVSLDHGASWTRSYEGLLESNLLVATAAPMGASQIALFTGNSILHRSDDNGLSWTPLFTFPSSMRSLTVSPTLASDGIMLVALADGNGVLYSTDGGLSWLPMITGFTETFAESVTLADDGSVFAVLRSKGLFRAPGVGAAWTHLSNGFEPLSNLTSDHYRSVVVSPYFADDGALFVATFEGLYRSDDRGDTVRQADVYGQRYNRGVLFSPAYATDRRIFLGNYGGGVYATADVAPPAGSPGGPSLRAAGAGADLAPTGAGLTLLSPKLQTDAAASQLPWQPLAVGIEALYVQCLLASPAFATDQSLFYAQVGLWHSQDAGHDWEPLPTPSPQVIRALALSPEYDRDGVIFLGFGGGGGVYRSDDRGQTWTPVESGLVAASQTVTILPSPQFGSDETVFLASRAGGVYRSTSGGDRWTAQNRGITGTVWSLALSPDYPNDPTLLVGTQSHGVFRSIDGGETWGDANAGLPPGVRMVDSIALSPDFGADRTAFLTVAGAGVFKSVDAGSNWSAVGPGLPPDAPLLVVLSPDFPRDRTLVVSTYDWVYRSQDAGESFTRMPTYMRIDDIGQLLHVEGTWATPVVNGVHGPGLSVSTSVDDVVDLVYHCRSLRWLAAKGPDGGMAEVRMDGDLAAVVDLYAPVAGLPEVVFERIFPTVGAHEVSVRNTGLAHPESVGIALRSDGFELTF